MREKIKEYIMVLSIFVMIIVVVSSLINIKYLSDNQLSIFDDDSNKEYVKELKERLNKLPEDKCTKSINNLFDYYDKTSIKSSFEEINRNDLFKLYYGSDDMVDSYGYTVISAIQECEIDNYLSDKERSKFNQKILGVFYSIDSVVNKYAFKYEISFMDYLNEFELDSMEYYLGERSNEINVLEYLLDFAESRGN